MKKRNLVIYRIYSLLIYIGLLLNLQCIREDKKVTDPQGEKLFKMTISHISTYTDSLTNITDSAQLQKIIKDFEDKLIKIQYQYPPEIYLQLTEDENDSIAKLSEIFILKRNKRLQDLRKKEVNDSL